MIRRPPRKIGGSIGQEIDAIWEALARVAPVEGDGVQIDHTTRGAVVRAIVPPTEAPARVFQITYPLAPGIARGVPIRSVGFSPGPLFSGTPDGTAAEVILLLNRACFGVFGTQDDLFNTPPANQTFAAVRLDVVAQPMVNDNAIGYEVWLQISPFF